MVTIVLSCVIFILSASPDLRHKPAHCDNPVCDNNPDLCPDSIICAPETPKWFKFIELACILVFSIEYFVRVGTVATVPLRLVSPHVLLVSAPCQSRTAYVSSGVLSHVLYRDKY